MGIIDGRFCQSTEDEFKCKHSLSNICEIIKGITNKSNYHCDWKTCENGKSSKKDLFEENQPIGINEIIRALSDR